PGFPSGPPRAPGPPGATGPAAPHRGTAQVVRPSPHPRPGPVAPLPGQWGPPPEQDLPDPRRSANGSGRRHRPTPADMKRTPPGYQLLKTQAGDCAPAAVGEPTKVLATAGCTQLVRATLVSADKVFVVTAGLLNLATQAGAQQANDALGTAVGAQKGRFTGFDAGGPSAVFAKAATQLGWDARG